MGLKLWAGIRRAGGWWVSEIAWLITERSTDVARLDPEDEDGWAALAEHAGDSRLEISLQSPEICIVKVPIPAGTIRARAAVRAGLEKRSPLLLEAACWSTPAPGKGDVLVRHVVIAHRDELRRISGAFGARGLPRPSFVALLDGERAVLMRGEASRVAQRRAATIGMTIALLASIPLTTWIGATLIGSLEARTIEGGAGAGAASRIADMNDAARANAALSARPTLSGQLYDLAARLPADASLHSIRIAGYGGTVLEIDTPDPDAVLSALHNGDTMVRHVTGEVSIPDRGIRLTIGQASN